MPWEFWGQEERTRWDISGWSLCLGTIVRTSCEALSLIPMSRTVALLHISQWSLTWSTGECFWHLYRLGRLLWGPAKSWWIPALHLGESYPKARCLEGNISCLSFRYFLLKFFFLLNNFQIASVSVPIAQVSMPLAPHRQCQGMLLMLNWKKSEKKKRNSFDNLTVKYKFNTCTL